LITSGTKHRLRKVKVARVRTAFGVVSAGFGLVSAGFGLVTAGFGLVTAGFSLVTAGFGLGLGIRSHQTLHKLRWNAKTASINSTRLFFLHLRHLVFILHFGYLAPPRCETDCLFVCLFACMHACLCLFVYLFLVGNFFNHIFGMYQFCDYQLPMPVPNTNTSLVNNAFEIKKFEIEFEIKKCRS
jgi:hypothetical protein